LSDKEKDIGSRKNIILEFYLANIQYFFEFLCKGITEEMFSTNRKEDRWTKYERVDELLLLFS
jgi:hypothetical protein